MPVEKQFKTLYDLALFIEQNCSDTLSSHFLKLQKYHDFLSASSDQRMIKLSKEFFKVKNIDHQFQIYLLNLERALGQSKKEYDFLVNTGDKKTANKKKYPIICILDSIRSAHNVGAMFRNADCFAIEEIILSGLCPSPLSPQVQKTAMGTTEEVKWSISHSILETVEKYKSMGHQVWAIETGRSSTPLHSQVKPDAPLVLIFGHEQFGISLELLTLCDKIVEIELYGKKNSLNVSVSQAICLHHVTQLLNN